MKTHRKKKGSRKQVAFIILGVGLVLVIGGVIWYVLRQNNTATNSTSISTNSQSDASDAKNKQDFLDNQKEDKDNTTNTNTDPTKSDNEKPTTPTDPTISLSAKTAGDSVIITTNLSTISSGTCTLIITGGVAPVTKTAEVIYTPEYSSCAGFSVKKSELSAASWNITLGVKTNEKTLTKTITYTP